MSRELFMKGTTVNTYICQTGEAGKVISVSRMVEFLSISYTEGDILLSMVKCSLLLSSTSTLSSWNNRLRVIQAVLAWEYSFHRATSRVLFNNGRNIMVSTLDEALVSAPKASKSAMVANGNVSSWALLSVVYRMAYWWIDSNALRTLVVAIVCTSSLCTVNWTKEFVSQAVDYSNVPVPPRTCRLKSLDSSFFSNLLATEPTMRADSKRTRNTAALEMSTSRSPSSLVVCSTDVFVPDRSSPPVPVESSSTTSNSSKIETSWLSLPE